MKKFREYDLFREYNLFREYYLKSMISRDNNLILLNDISDYEAPFTKYIKNLQGLTVHHKVYSLKTK